MILAILLCWWYEAKGVRFGLFRQLLGTNYFVDDVML